CFLGALSALVGTGAGRALLARVTESALARVFTGSIEVADVHGSLLTGVTLTGVRLFDADTTLVAWLPGAALAYHPFALAAGPAVRAPGRPARGPPGVVASGAGRRDRYHSPRVREQRSRAAAGGCRRPAAGDRGLARARSASGAAPRVRAAGGARARVVAAG